MNSTFNGSLYLASSSQKFTLNTCNELDESIQNGNRSQPRKKGESERNINWTPHFQCCIWGIWRVHTCAKCPRKADNMFNRNNIEIFINTTQLLIFIWRKTLPTDTKKKKKSPHNFSFSIFSFAYSFHASTFFAAFSIKFFGFCCRDTIDWIMCVSQYMLLLFLARLFIGLFLCYQTHFHSISSTISCNE